MRLENLKLEVTELATGRAEHIRRLNYVTSPKGSYRWDEASRRRTRIRIRINEVLLGMRAPAAASTNWPSVVQSIHLRLLKYRDPSEGGICRYRNETPNG
jgi:hypothetical protein